MITYKIGFHSPTFTVHLVTESNTLPVDDMDLGTFNFDDSPTGNKPIYSHVRHKLNRVGVMDMSQIIITYDTTKKQENKDNYQPKFPTFVNPSVNPPNAGTLGPVSANFYLDDPIGTTVATITGLGNGERIKDITPNDGRLIRANGNTIVVGNSKSKESTIEYTFTTNAGRKLKMNIQVSAKIPVPSGFQLLLGSDGAQLLGVDGAPLYGKAV